MNKESAGIAYSTFHNQKFLPAVEKALTDGRINDDLIDDLIEAIRILRTVGPSSDFGKTMLGEVLFTILCESLPRRKK